MSEAGRLVRTPEAPASPHQRTGELPVPLAPPPVSPAPANPAATADVATTVVMPYAGSRVAGWTRGLRAWMVTLPVDFAATVAPLLWVQTYWRGILFTGVATVVVFAYGGLYRGRRHLSILDELPALLGRLLAAAAAVAVIASVRHDQVAYVGELMRLVAVSAGLVLVGRLITRWIVVTARRRRWVEHGAIIIGGGPVAAELARLLRRYPEYGLRFAGFVDDDRPGRHAAVELRPWIGRLDDIESMIRSTESNVLIIADVACPDAQLLELVRRPACAGCDIFVVPRLQHAQTQSGISDHIGAIPVARLRRPTLTGPRWALKRASDIVLSLLALVVLSPVLLLCAIAVRLEGGPGVLFRQQRIGRDGKLFSLLKFRSMKPADEIESQTRWSVTHDPRVGPVGRFLRRTSLDELPQLWNILRGDMSIVGPRPERPYFVERFSAEHPHYSRRHRVPAGLTGLAQVSGLRGDTPIADRARFDNYYIENWSLWLDVKVLLRSFAAVFRTGGR